MKKTSRSQHGTMNELNITPLLDLVFVLLVIFIIATPTMMNNLEMTLPPPKPPPKTNQPKPKVQQIIVDSDGRTFLNNDLVSIPDLKGGLKELKESDPELTVVVKGADDTAYQNMINVLDVLQQLNITRVGLPTRAGQ